MSRKVAFSLITVLLVVGAAVAGLYFLHHRQRAQATLFLRQGETTVRQRSGARSASAPQVLKVGEGDTIETGPGSRALLVLGPDATAELGPDSEARLKSLSVTESGPSTVQLETRHGDTWHELSGSEDSETLYDILTPSAMVTLSAGRLHVTVSEDGRTRVEVSQGVARARAENTEVEIREGEYTSIAPSRAPAVPRPTVARVLFISQRGGNADIWFLDEQGGEHQLTDDAADDLAPAWSPDGSRIAFESVRGGNNSEIYVMNEDGSGQVNLTRNSVPDHAPAWSPDGTRIAFESVRDDARDIYVMNVDGSEEARLTCGVGLSFVPGWTIDGEGIVFTRIEADSNHDGVVDSSDMGAPFLWEEETGAVHGFWGGRMVYDQLVFPWARRMVG